MSDFLDSLAARAVAPVPAIRPAIRSPYEAPAPVASTWIESATASVPVGATPAAPWNSARSQPPARAPELEAGPRVREALTPLRPSASPEAASLEMSSGPSSDPPSPSRAFAARVLAVPAPPKQASKRLQAAPAPTAGPAPAPPSAIAIPPAVVPAIVKSAIAPAALPLPHADGQIRPVRAGGNAGSQTPHGRGLSAAPLPVAYVAQPSPAAAEEPRLEPPRPRRSPPLAKAIPLLPDESRSRPASSPSAPPAPEVNITIGRVEIRAALPAAQAPMPPARATGPHLSLDAYLRRNASRPHE